MLISLILGMVLGGITVLFALENTAAVTVSFLTFQGSAPLAVVLLVSMLSGIAFTLLLLLPFLIRDEIAKKIAKREKRALEDEYAAYRTQNPVVRPVVPSSETPLAA